MFWLGIAALLLLGPPPARADPPASSQPQERPSFQILDLVEQTVKGTKSLGGSERLQSTLTAAQLELKKAPPEKRESLVERHLPAINAAADALNAADAPEAAQRINDAMAELNNSAGNFEASLRYSERSLNYDPQDRDALISRSAANAGLNRYASAFADADRAAKIAPDDAAAFRARALASYGLKNYAQAVEDARRSLALNPNDQASYYVMRLAEGKVPALKLGRLDAQLAGEVQREYHGMVQQLSQASERAQQPADPAPKPVERLVQAAATKINLKDYLGAVTDADRALEADPNNAAAFYYRAAAKNLLGRYDDAAQDASQALLIDPGDVRARDARSWAYNSLGRFRDAISDANHSLEIRPDNGYAYWNLSYAHEHMGDLSGMLRDLRAAASINPAFEPAYRDAAARHGLETEPLPFERFSKPPAARGRDEGRRRSFAMVLGCSLIGGILMALGFVHLYGDRKTAAKEPAPRLPELGSGYILGRPLGRGGMGLVYEAFDKALERKVAVKVMHAQSDGEPQARQRFLQEARTVAALHHPAIVDIHSIVEDGAQLCLVFELLEGRTLEEILAQRGRLPLAEARMLLKPVCQGLEYAHRNGVVHRDLKPGNIMVTSSGQVKIMDFGISRPARQAGGPLTEAERATARGTPSFMAPEQENGVVRRESDIFSLGACLYEMVTGKTPFPDLSRIEPKLMLDYKRPTQIVAGLPAELDRLMDFALQPDPEERIRTASDFWALLERVDSGSRVAA